VLFNRSWYNRAGVEPVMGFCTPEEQENFMRAVVPFEEMLVNSGLILFKYYLDITHSEQVKRLEERRTNPLKQWKTSPIDQVAVQKWKAYSHARNIMLQRTHHTAAPWVVVHANQKKTARLNLMRHLLAHLDYPDKDSSVLDWDDSVIVEWPIATSIIPHLAE
ncbi:MAG: polyphosphate kinase 2, partial [Ferrovum sp.]|nr:polyphosphate kinase 2 [Ferrovum sp.]